MGKFRKESDSMGEVLVPIERLYGAQTIRSLTHFSIGSDLMPRELIFSFAVLKKASALANYEQGRLSKEKSALIVKVCDELMQGKHQEEFPLHVWMTGSGTQFNMNINEVISNRACQMKKKPLGSKDPLHPNDDVNMSQSSNDAFPSAMHIAAALCTKNGLIPAIDLLRRQFHKKAKKWEKIVKLGRTHMQDATPLTLGQEFSGYAVMLDENLLYLESSLKRVYALCLGGTAVGTGINTLEGFDRKAAEKIAEITKLPFITAANKFAYQGAHNPLVELSSALKALAVSLYKIGNDIRLLSSGPRAGFFELILPENEPGSSIMPGKVNPTQCEALCMLSLQVIANDLAVSLGNAGGFLEMNVYKPLIIYNLLHSIRLLQDGALNFEKYCLRNTEPNRKKIQESLENSLMLVTALTPKIGYDKAAKAAHYAFEQNLSLKKAALQLKLLSEKEYDSLIDPYKMCFPTKKKSS